MTHPLRPHGEEKLKQGTKVLVKIHGTDRKYEGKIVGSAIDNVIRFYIIEPTEEIPGIGNPEDIYPYSHFTLPESEFEVVI